MNFRPFLILFLLGSNLSGQTEGGYPQDYFSSPLDTALVLKGTFGEIRPDHFHSGLDLSTGEKEGMPVHAAADGYVSRIKISSEGFGKALYITHPNGFVTVYAHLKSFDPDIEKYIRKEQETKESYEIELLPKPKQLKVKKGRLIALSGNTGGSEGPHLHFEIRDEKSEEPINPLLFSIKTKDTLPPVIKSIRVYPQPLNGSVEASDSPFSYPVIYKDGRYQVNVPDYIKVFGNIEFGIETIDFANNSNASLGIYSITLLNEKDTLYDFKADRINFNDARSANAVIDYAYRYEEDRTVYRCFKLPGLPPVIPLKKVNDEGGMVNFSDEQSHMLHFRIADFSGNTAELNVEILSMPSSIPVKYTFPPARNIRLSPMQAAAIHKSNEEIIIPKGAIYDTYYLTIEEETSADKNFFSKIVSAGDPSQALNSALTVGLRAYNLPDSMKPKAVILRIDPSDRQTCIGGEWTDNFLTAQSKQFGRFAIGLDTTAPVIKFQKNNGDSILPSEIKFHLSDDLSGIRFYRAELNGKWFLMEYDAKSGMLSRNISPEEKEKLKSPLVLSLVVRDARNNTATFSQHFSR